MVTLRVGASELTSEFRNPDNRSEGGARSRNLTGRGNPVRGYLQDCCRIAAAVLILAWATPALGQVPLRIGRVKLAEGAAFVVRDGRTIRAVQGDALRQSDALVTGPDGYMGATLQDDTRVSLGPESRLHLDRYTYEPATGRFACVLTVVRGLAVYISGQIARLSPDSVRLKTPTGIVGVRGTTLAVRVGAQ